jgi:putative peptide zinc metalloprotease protein
VLALLALVAAAGAAAFAAGLLGGASTPLVVADDLGLGALVFLAGRLAVVLVHELAHGLALVAVGRRVVRAGLQLVVVLPLAFVDTSEAWFEPRRRRLVVTAAGPASDAVVGGAFALVALLAGADGALGQTAFQVALAAYVGALFNLNPFADRDGYHLLVDLLGEPDLRRRGRMRLARALAGRGGGPRGATALAYPVAALAWSVVGVGLTVVAVLRYAEQVRALAPDPVVPALVVALCALLLAPAALTVGVPLLQRRRSRR